MSRRDRHLFPDERGVAASEFALILPMLTILFFGFYEAGRMFWDYSIVQSSARDAARYAARLPMTCGSGTTGTFTDGTDEGEVKNLTRTGTLDNTGDPLINGWTDNASVTVTINCVANSSGTVMSGRYEGYSKIPTVSISAAAPHGMLFAGLVGTNLSTITVENAQAYTE